MTSDGGDGVAQHNLGSQLLQFGVGAGKPAGSQIPASTVPDVDAKGESISPETDGEGDAASVCGKGCAGRKSPAVRTKAFSQHEVIAERVTRLSDVVERSIGARNVQEQERTTTSALNRKATSNVKPDRFGCTECKNGILGKWSAQYAKRN